MASSRLHFHCRRHLFARWIYLASGAVELSKDEAYQWIWSKHLAAIVLQQTPGIAFIQFFGTSLWGDTPTGRPVFLAAVRGDF